MKNSNRRGDHTGYTLLLPLLVLLCGCHNGRLPATPEHGGDNAAAAKNVILFVGDGMGAAQVAASGIFLHGAAGTLSFESFPSSGTVSTGNASGEVTDSAAAATAMATGRKVSNRVLSVAIPGDGAPLETVLERLASMGKATGLVTTSDVADATPAAFGAHRADRGEFPGVVSDYLWGSRPRLLFGGSAYLTEALAAGAGYSVVTDCASLAALDRSSGAPVAGLFGGGELPYELDGTGNLPRLSEMTLEALSILEQDPDGIFLLVEGGRIDHACHANDLARMVAEVAEFDRSVAVAVGWGASHGDTLVVVLADHETGGLSVAGGGGAGLLPDVTWGGTVHTGVPVPYYSWRNGGAGGGGSGENTTVRDLLLAP